MPGVVVMFSSHFPEAEEGKEQNDHDKTNKCLSNPSTSFSSHILFLTFTHQFSFILLSFILFLFLLSFPLCLFVVIHTLLHNA